jgi:hypothetical protein
MHQPNTIPLTLFSDTLNLCFSRNPLVYIFFKHGFTPKTRFVVSISGFTLSLVILSVLLQNVLFFLNLSSF